MEWSNVSNNESVINLLKQREAIENKIKTLDKDALINYELERLAEPNIVSLGNDGVIENNVKTFVYCDCGNERFGHFSKCQSCLDMGSGHSGGGNF